MGEYFEPTSHLAQAEGTISPAPELFINRELSWLEFNKRVLAQSVDEGLPLMERLKFLAIYYSNLDEFFMVRVGSLTDQSVMEPSKLDDKTGLNADAQIAAILQRVTVYAPLAEQAYRSICEQLKNNDVDIVDLNHLTKLDEQIIQKYFHEEIKPLLSPQIIDRHHPFPFLKNKEQFVAAVFEGKDFKNKDNKNNKDSKEDKNNKNFKEDKDFKEDKNSKEKEGKLDNLKMGIVPISHLPQYFIFNINQRRKVLFTADIVCHFVQKLFNKQKVQEKQVIRITRNADISVNEGLFDYDIDFRGVMQELLKKRRRLDVVRVQFSRSPSERLAKHLCNRLGVSKEKLMVQSVPLDFSLGFSLGSDLNAQVPRRDWFYKEAKQSVPFDFSQKNALAALSERDFLLAFPFHSTKPFVDLLYEAADDPAVISVQISLYRLANHSKISAALCHAAEKGKEVLCVLELRARFDEQNNINYATVLEEAGCTVIYGLSDYKLHAKLCLITRKVHNKISYITQIGTGNYNEKTSELYTDLSLMTSNQAIGEDATRVFQALCMGEAVEATQTLWVAPNCFESNVLSCIQAEIEAQKAGEAGYVFIKVNSFNDMEIMEKLIEASQAGVEVELCIRGICCLCPKVAGYTENITIKSIVGRYLEHSRIFLFGRGTRERMYMGSGDLLNRNTRRRVEVFAPITAENVRHDLHKIIDDIRSDNINAWEMASDGSYQKISSEHREILDSHISLYKYFSASLALPQAPATLSSKIYAFFHHNK